MVRPNASVDPEPLRQALGAAGEPREKTAVVAGRLIPLKGISFAIRAIALLPDWRLEIIGAGPDERRLRRLAKRLGVEARVTFTPWLAQQSLWRRMAESAVVLVPSLRDASPLVIAEASALGVPVVALEQGGPRVLARRSGAVHLVPLASRRSVPAAIARTLDIVSTLEVEPSDAFSIASLSDDLAWIYREVIGEAPRDDEGAARPHARVTPDHHLSGIVPGEKETRTVVHRNLASTIGTGALVGSLALVVGALVASEPQLGILALGSRYWRCSRPPCRRCTGSLRRSRRRSR